MNLPRRRSRPWTKSPRSVKWPVRCTWITSPRWSYAERTTPQRHWVTNEKRRKWALPMCPFTCPSRNKSGGYHSSKCCFICVVKELTMAWLIQPIDVNNLVNKLIASILLEIDMLTVNYILSLPHVFKLSCFPLLIWMLKVAPKTQTRYNIYDTSMHPYTHTFPRFQTDIIPTYYPAYDIFHPFNAPSSCFSTTQVLLLFIFYYYLGSAMASIGCSNGVHGPTHRSWPTRTSIRKTRRSRSSVSSACVSTRSARRKASARWPVSGPGTSRSASSRRRVSIGRRSTPPSVSWRKRPMRNWPNSKRRRGWNWRALKTSKQ